MKPVTESDIARYARGEISDPEEAARIARAMRECPELDVLFHSLTDGVFDDLDEDGASADGPEVSPALAAMLARARDYQALQATARLYRLKGSLPVSSADTEISIPLLCGSQSALTCRFTPSSDRPGVYHVHVPLPPNRRALSLAVGDLHWGDPTDDTEVAVHTTWSDRPAPSPVRAAARSTERGVVSATELAAKSDSQPVTGASKRREHQGCTVDVRVDGQKSWSAEIFRLDVRPFWPIPLMLTALAASGEAIASEVRLLRQGERLVENLFENCTERVYWLNVAPLKTKDLCRLKPLDAAELLGSCESAVRVLRRIPESSGEYLLDLSDEVVQSRLASPHAVLVLEIADVEGEVQP